MHVLNLCDYELYVYKFCSYIYKKIFNSFKLEVHIVKLKYLYAETWRMVLLTNIILNKILFDSNIYCKINQRLQK